MRQLQCGGLITTRARQRWLWKGWMVLAGLVDTMWRHKVQFRRGAHHLRRVRLQHTWLHWRVALPLLHQDDTVAHAAMQRLWLILQGRAMNTWVHAHVTGLQERRAMQRALLR